MCEVGNGRPCTDAATADARGPGFSVLFLFVSLPPLRYKCSRRVNRLGLSIARIFQLRMIFILDRGANECKVAKRGNERENEKKRKRARGVVNGDD